MNISSKKPIGKRHVPWQMTVGAILLVIVLLIYAFGPEENDVTDGWQVYEDSAGSFSFKYPQNLFVHRGPTGKGDWLFISQRPDEPTFAFEDVCNGSLDYVNVNYYGEFVPGYGYDSVDEFLGIIESNYKTVGGGKIKDVKVGDMRYVVFDASSRTHGKKIIRYVGDQGLEFSYKKCTGGTIPLEMIAETARLSSFR